MSVYLMPFMKEAESLVDRVIQKSEEDLKNKKKSVYTFLMPSKYCNSSSMQFIDSTLRARNDNIYRILSIEIDSDFAYFNIFYARKTISRIALIWTMEKIGNLVNKVIEEVKIDE